MPYNTKYPIKVSFDTIELTARLGAVYKSKIRSRFDDGDCKFNSLLVELTIPYIIDVYDNENEPPKIIEGLGPLLGRLKSIDFLGLLYNDNDTAERKRMERQLMQWKYGTLMTVAGNIQKLKLRLPGGNDRMVRVIDFHTISKFNAMDIIQLSHLDSEFSTDVILGDETLNKGGVVIVDGSEDCRPFNGD